MKLEGKIDIDAPPRAVWDFILDPVRLSSCIPGTRDMRQVDERTIEGAINAAIGPMQSDFVFTSVVTRSEFPNDLIVEMTGTDSLTRSRLQASVSVELEVLGSGLTRMRYRAAVEVAGRLAILGDMVLRVTAAAMIDKVARCLRARLDSVSIGDPER